MEPNKTDKQFSDKLNSRIIHPSEQAWDRLDAMLSVAEEKKTRRPLVWLNIAASILVLVTINVFILMQNVSKIKLSSTIGGTEVKKERVKNPSKSIQNTIIGSQKQNEAVAISNDKQTAEKRHELIKKSIINQKIALNQKSNSNQYKISKNKPIEFMLSEDVAIQYISKIVNNNGTVVNTENNSKSDESLLADLDKAAKQSTNQKMVVKIDAKSLLSQADGEVEYTFREKVINRVNKNYQGVKVALVNRNKE
jgi:hypothetical protein